MKKAYHLNMGWGNSAETAWYSVSGANSYNNYRIARRMLYEIIPNRSQQTSVSEDANETLNAQQMISVENALKLDDSASVEQWCIYNTYGRLMASGCSQNIDMEYLPFGLYTIVVQTNTATTTYHFFKQY